MLDPSALAMLAIDATFATFGRAAIYRPAEVGDDIACIVVKAEPDISVMGPATTRAIARSHIFDVRKSEVASPTREGIFRFVGGTEDFRVISDPKTEDHERLVWSCTVAPI